MDDESRKWWESRSAGQLSAAYAGAWDACDRGMAWKVKLELARRGTPMPEPSWPTSP